MTAAARRPYEASLVKRQRATAAEVNTRRSGLFEIVAAMRPMTVAKCSIRRRSAAWSKNPKPVTGRRKSTSR
jgi:hypothetical protein